MKCGNLNKRDERKKTLDMRIYLVVRIATKAPLRPRCWSTHKEYRFPAIKSLPWTQSRSPWSRFPLNSFIKKGGGLYVPAQSCWRRSTSSRMVVDVPASHQCSKRPAHWDLFVVYSRISSQSTTSYYLTRKWKEFWTSYSQIWLWT